MLSRAPERKNLGLLPSLNDGGRSKHLLAFGPVNNLKHGGYSLLGVRSWSSVGEKLSRVASCDPMLDNLDSNSLDADLLDLADVEFKAEIVIDLVERVVFVGDESPAEGRGVEGGDLSLVGFDGVVLVCAKYEDAVLVVSKTDAIRGGSLGVVPVVIDIFVPDDVAGGGDWRKVHGGDVLLMLPVRADFPRVGFGPDSGLPQRCWAVSLKWAWLDWIFMALESAIFF